MFQIGASLRDARQRLGLELADVERATKVRTQYLRALEEEEFDALPAGGYRKTFLRGYATYLGLDAGAFVDEYVTRFERPESPELELPPPARRRRLPARRIAAAVAAAALASILTVWFLTGSEPASRRAARTPAHASTPSTTRAARSAALPRAPGRPPVAGARTGTSPVSVVFAATSGSCWLLVRRGGAQGQILYEAILSQGQELRLRARTLWARIGNPGVLKLTVDGRAQALPYRTGDVIVDRRGVHAAV